ncbi:MULTISPECIES: hypothetical protein [Haloferax]|uniref:Uncharacterized protein n=3 Tax=Haloferax volcanii TaxID=2246 RepID=A0A384LJG5_HALVD|nr:MULTISPECIES: hypothetical protein [Haloferax]ADE03637.1 uncharacterized protein HVO_0363 [Haloferax volcanii DS2]ELY25070.1 hypothetical protein C498_16883 [Haloferax volcanii DS2]MBS8119052.1 hypothetical protein [Haloferax volcanii]MBS8124065.1 hypothetical protein [Haloferax volcanii]MBS8127934.1 hypothetical protein [Haloferax volcanii]
MDGSVTLSPLELLAVAALPLSAISGVLKAQIQRRFGQQKKTDDDSS